MEVEEEIDTLLRVLESGSGRWSLSSVTRR